MSKKFLTLIVASTLLSPVMTHAGVIGTRDNSGIIVSYGLGGGGNAVLNNNTKVDGFQNTTNYQDTSASVGDSFTAYQGEDSDGNLIGSPFGGSGSAFASGNVASGSLKARIAGDASAHPSGGISMLATAQIFDRITLSGNSQPVPIRLSMSVEGFINTPDPETINRRGLFYRVTANNTTDAFNENDSLPRVPDGTVDIYDEMPFPTVTVDTVAYRSFDIVAALQLSAFVDNGGIFDYDLSNTAVFELFVPKGVNVSSESGAVTASNFPATNIPIPSTVLLFVLSIIGLGSAHYLRKTKSIHC